MNQTTFSSYKKVFVVEDDPLVAETIKLIIDRHGYRAQCFESAEECLFETRRGEPDLILADVFLAGGMSGMEMARQLRASHPALRCMLISARATLLHLDAERAFNGELFDLYEKPIHPTTLVKLIDSHFSRA